MNRIFAHNTWFRLLGPVLYGFLAYCLILLVFGNLSQLEENFFTQELWIPIGATFIVLESNRLVILLLDRIYPLNSPGRESNQSEPQLVGRFALQFLGSGLITVLVVSLSLTLYFIHIVGYRFGNFNTELITFNIIFLVTSIFYNLLHASYTLLSQKNELELSYEDQKRRELDYQLESFKNMVNPELFYTCLETLIPMVHTDPDKSEEFVDRLSLVYRYILDNRQNELTSLEKEAMQLKI